MREPVRVCLLPVGLPAQDRPLIVQLLFFLLQLRQLRTDANDLQEGVRLLPGAGFQEAGKVQGQLLDEFIQELLARLPAAGIGDLQGAVFAGALHDQAVGQGDFDPGRHGAAFPGGIAGPVPVAAQGPADGIQDGRLPLGVIAADDGQAALAGDQLHSLDPLDVLDLQSVDFDWHIHNLLDYLMLSF